MLKNNLITKLNINIPPTSTIVIGCSAGPDSMALLHYLMTNTTYNIVVAHINHNIRKESIEEEIYISTFCQKNKLTFEHTTIKNYEENNFENEARKKRYAFYETTLKKHNTKYLFLAHHGDDLIETILMKIIRGSNLEGYAGIKAITKQKDYYIIRPFLPLTKQDLITYNKENNLTYYIDNSNQDQTYTRNRYRHTLLPLLKKENKDIHTQFLKYSNTLLEYNTYIEEYLETIYSTIINNNTLNIEKFNKLHPFIKKNLLYKYLNNNYNNEPNIIKEQHILNIFSILNNKKPNLSLNLPLNKLALKTYKYFTIKTKTTPPSNYKILLKDTNIIDNIIIKKITKSETDGNDICRLNSKNIKLPLYLRNKEPGDYIETKGLNGKKKLKAIFIEAKIPLSLRDKYPLLVDADNQILWIPNIKKSKFNTKKDEIYDIILKYCEKEENNE